MTEALSASDVPTPLGPARLHVTPPPAEGTEPPVGTLVLGHGAGGGITAPDLRAASSAAAAGGWRVVLVEQPWRVAGRRVAPAPARLDVGWSAALAALSPLDGPLIVGGRSAGARVACRTALDLGAVAVCCLAFPLHPPGRPDRTRAGELADAGVPVLVVQGRRDPFGSADDVAALGLGHVEVSAVDGDHGMRGAGVAPAVSAAVSGWLAGVAG